MQENQEKKKGINIELTEDVAQGNYVNLAIVGHSNSEFILDFIRVVPGLQKVKVSSRLIMTPEHAKRLLRTLHDNISKYEAHHGEIEINNETLNNIPIGFGSPEAEA